MKTTLYSIITLFVALTLPFAQKTSDAQTNAWNDWLDRQTDWILVDALEEWQERDLIAELDESLLTSIRSGIRAQLKTQITETKKKVRGTLRHEWIWNRSDDGKHRASETFWSPNC